MLEGGYGFGSRLEFELEPEQDDDLEHIPLEGSRMGGLATRAGQVRAGLVVALLAYFSVLSSQHETVRSLVRRRMDPARISSALAH